MKKRLTTKTGDLLKIPFRKELHTYGRVLIDGSYAIYDCPSSSGRQDFDTIIGSDILFTAYVDIFAIKDGYWTIITNIELEERLKTFYPRYFNPAPTNPVNINFYEVYKNEIENAIHKDWIKTGKMQLGGIFGHSHIESRINCYYDGKRNEDVQRMITLFKNIVSKQQH